jgi:hypothetical protein
VTHRDVGLCTLRLATTVPRPWGRHLEQWSLTTVALLARPARQERVKNRCGRVAISSTHLGVARQTVFTARWPDPRPLDERCQEDVDVEDAGDT